MILIGSVDEDVSYQVHKSNCPSQLGADKPESSEPVQMMMRSTIGWREAGREGGREGVNQHDDGRVGEDLPVSNFASL